MTAVPPLVPGRDEASRWAAEELAGPPYRDARPGWLEEAWRQFVDWLRSLDGSAGAGGSNIVPLLLVTALILIAVAVIAVRPRRNARRRDERDVFDAEALLSPAAHRQRAAAAAARGDWQAAVVEQFRALARAAEDRAVLEPLPGRTADEVAGQLGQAFAVHAGELDQAARTFDAVRYGRAGAGARDYSDLARLDAALEALKPDYRGDKTDTLVRPR